MIITLDSMDMNIGRICWEIDTLAKATQKISQQDTLKDHGLPVDMLRSRFDIFSKGY